MKAEQHIFRAWIEFEYAGDVSRSVLVVETDVELRIGSRSFDEMAVQQVVQKALETSASTGAAADTVRLVPVGYYR